MILNNVRLVRNYFLSINEPFLLFLANIESNNISCEQKKVNNHMFVVTLCVNNEVD